jgi:hypothetical protein
MLDYMAPSKADDVLCSPGRVADSFGWKQVSSRAPQADGCQRFCIYGVMVGPGHPRCLQISFCSSLHCVFAFLTKMAKKNREKEKEKKR